MYGCIKSKPTVAAGKRLLQKIIKTRIVLSISFIPEKARMENHKPLYKNICSGRTPVQGLPVKRTFAALLKKKPCQT
jgi:hypothetical protein